MGDSNGASNATREGATGLKMGECNLASCKQVRERTKVRKKGRNCTQRKDAEIDPNAFQPLDSRAVAGAAAVES